MKLTWKTDDDMCAGQLETHNEFFTISHPSKKYPDYGLALIDGGHEIATLEHCKLIARRFFKIHFNEAADELEIPERYQMAGTSDWEKDNREVVRN